MFCISTRNYLKARHSELDKRGATHFRIDKNPIRVTERTYGL